MTRHTFCTLATCALLGAAAVCSWAQAAPGGAAAPAAAGARGGGAGGGRRGGGRGVQTPPGPPAPVPPEVAIPRPTSDELAKINADLKQFINTSPDKDLLTKYESQLSVQMPRDNSAIRPAPGARGSRNDRLTQVAKDGGFDIMFIGDSITELLGTDADPQGNPGGKPIMDKYFADAKVANFGVSGDSTQGVLWGFMNGEGQGHKPKAVTLMIGTNNNGNTAEEIAEGVGADVYELRKDFPDAKILLVGIFPRGETTTDAGRIRVAQANKIIAKLDDQKHVFYVDLSSKMLTPDGKLIGFRTSDHLHPVTEGFEIWISSIAPTLKDWAK